MDVRLFNKQSSVKRAYEIHTLASIHPKTLFPQLRSQQHRTSFSFLSFCVLGWLTAFVIGLSSAWIIFPLQDYHPSPAHPLSGDSWMSFFYKASASLHGWLWFPSWVFIWVLRKTSLSFSLLDLSYIRPSKNIIRLSIVPKP